MDPSHLQMLSENLIRIIEPYSVVELAHVAAKIGLPLSTVESKLSQMILDLRLHGTLDQGKGHLLVFPKSDPDKTYADAIATIGSLNNVVETLHARGERMQ